MTTITDPICIANMELRNRLYSAPMVSLYATEDGDVTPRLVDIYRQRGKGGWGLVCVEATTVRYDGRLFTRMLGLYRDQQIAGMNELAEVIRDGGSKSCLQIMHGGRQANPRFNGNVPVMAPSPVAPWPPGSDLPREMTSKDCEEIADCFALAAGRAKEAGFDSVQLHAAHGFLLQQFLSPYTNQRKDKYGDRLGYLTEVIKKVKAVVGDGYPLGLRVSADEFLGDKGLTIDSFVEDFAPAIEQAGVHWIDVSAGTFETLVHWVPPLYFKNAYLVDLAQRVKQAVSIPVSGIGKINDPELAAKLIAEETVDIVAFGRQALADHEFAKKLIEGRHQEIRRCIVCDMGCADRLLKSVGVQCAVNCEFGQEPAAKRFVKSDNPRKVLVVGGGIAGMEAARVLALRGHQVTLCEKDSKLGGAVKLAVAIPGVRTGELWRAVDYLEAAIRDLGVTIELGQTITGERVQSLNPDVVVLATGAVPTMPDLPGIDSPQVVTSDDYLRREATIGENVVVLGGNYGAETALSLTKAGKKVTIVEETANIAAAPYLYLGRMLVLQQYLKEENVAIISEAEVKAIMKDGVEIVDSEGKERTLVADTVVVAVGRTRNAELARTLAGKGRRIFEVGDCLEPANILRAMRSAASIAGDI